MKKEKGKISAILREQALDKGLLEKAGRCAQDYLDSVLDRPVFPGEDLRRARGFRREPATSPGGQEIWTGFTVSDRPGRSPRVGGRYFGFVNGGSSPPRWQ